MDIEDRHEITCCFSSVVGGVATTGGGGCCCWMDDAALTWSRGSNVGSFSSSLSGCPSIVIKSTTVASITCSSLASPTGSSSSRGNQPHVLFFDASREIGINLGDSLFKSLHDEEEVIIF